MIQPLSVRDLVFLKDVLLLPLFFKAPNLIGMRYERVSKASLIKYKAQNSEFHINQASAKLWAKGLDWRTAREIVTQAFEGTFTETVG